MKMLILAAISRGLRGRVTDVEECEPRDAVDDVSVAVLRGHIQVDGFEKLLGGGCGFGLSRCFTVVFGLHNQRLDHPIVAEARFFGGDPPLLDGSC